MPVLYNFQKGHAEYLPDDQVQSAVTSGTHSFRKNVPIRVVAPDGTPGYVPSENIRDAMSNGFQYQGNREALAGFQQKIAEERAQAFQGPMAGAQAGILGAARGLTFGASDVLIRGIYGEQGAEAVRELGEAQPVASIGGELAGGIFGGGAGLLGTGIRGAARVGQAATRGTAGLLGAARAETLLGKSVAKAVGATAEGALFGAGQAISEAALGNPDFNAQSAISTIGLSGLFSGALAGGAAPAIKAFGKLKQGLQNIDVPVVASKASNDAFNLADKAVEGLGEGYAKIMKIVRPMGDDVADDFSRAFAAADKDGRARIFRYLEDSTAAAEEASGAIRQVIDEGADAATNIMSARASLHPAIREELPKMTPKIRDSFLDSLTIIAKKVDDVRKREAYYAPGLSKQLESLIENTAELALDGRTNKVVLKRSITPERAHQITHNLRREIDDYIKPFKRDPSAAANATRDLAKDIRRQLTSHIRDAGTYGKAASDWAKIDDAYTKYQTALENIQKKIFRKTKRGEMGQVGDMITDTFKIDRYMRNPENLRGKDFRADLDALKESIVNMRQAGDEFAAKIGYPNSDDAIKALDATLENLKKVEQSRAALLAMNKVESFTGKSLTPLLIGGIAGGAIGEGLDLPGTGVAGAVLGAAAGNPRTLFVTSRSMKRSVLMASEPCAPPLQVS